MLRNKFFYGSLATALLFGIPFSASALISPNGISLNGIAINGTALNTSQIEPAASQDIVRVEGGQLAIKSSTIAP